MFFRILNYRVSFHVKKFYLKFLSIRELKSFIRFIYFNVFHLFRMILDIVP